MRNILCMWKTLSKQTKCVSKEFRIECDPGIHFDFDNLSFMEYTNNIYTKYILIKHTLEKTIHKKKHFWQNFFLISMIKTQMKNQKKKIQRTLFWMLNMNKMNKQTKKNTYE